MAKQSIESMYDLMFEMRSSLESLLQDAQELTAAAKTYGGEISRVIVEQMSKYFSPTIKNLIDNDQTPGSMIGIIRFLDSVPLSYTRIEPTMEDFVAPEDPQPNLMHPQGTSEVDALPNRASFANPEGVPAEKASIPMPESTSKIKEEKAKQEGIKVYSVVRVGGLGSHLGDDVANIEEQIVGDYNTKEEAEKKCALLNDSLLPFEKETLKASYEVKERYFIPEN